MTEDQRQQRRQPGGLQQAADVGTHQLNVGDAAIRKPDDLLNKVVHFVQQVDQVGAHRTSTFQFLCQERAGQRSIGGTIDILQQFYSSFEKTKDKTGKIT